jgi:hypothetical protein
MPSQFADDFVVLRVIFDDNLDEDSLFQSDNPEKKASRNKQNQ